MGPDGPSIGAVTQLLGNCPPRRAITFSKLLTHCWPSDILFIWSCSLCVEFEWFLYSSSHNFIQILQSMCFMTVYSKTKTVSNSPPAIPIFPAECIEENYQFNNCGIIYIYNILLNNKPLLNITPPPFKEKFWVWNNCLNNNNPPF